MASFRMVMAVISTTGALRTSLYVPGYSPKGPSSSRRPGRVRPSITISAVAGTSTSMVLHLTIFTASPRRPPAMPISSVPSAGRHCDAMAMMGSPPMTVAISVPFPLSSLRSIMVPKCRPLGAKQVMWFLSSSSIRCMEEFRTPVMGSLAICTPAVIYGPRSFSKFVRMGSLYRSTASPVSTTSCTGASSSPTVTGGINLFS